MQIVYQTSSRLRDIICDQHYNDTFHQKLESIQYNVALAITSAKEVPLEKNFIKN